MELTPETNDGTEISSECDAVVIGAGLGSLSCALRLANLGLKVQVFEQHTVPGGYAHHFRRQGFVFDVSLHGTGGLDKGGLIHSALKILGLEGRFKPQRRETQFTAQFPDATIELPNNTSQTIAALSGLFPDEASNIAALFAYLKELKRDVVGPSLDPKFKVPLGDRPSTQCANDTFGDVLARYVSDPKLLAILGQYWMHIGLPPSQSAATFSTCVFSSYALEGAYHVHGGGSAIANAMVERLTELGSACHVRQAVSQILVEGGKASGVVLDDGTQVGAPIVVSGANPHQTFFEMLPDDAVSEVYLHRLRQMKSSTSLYATYIGLDCPPSELGIPKENFYFNHSYDLDDAYHRAMEHNIANTDWCLANYETSPAVSYPDGGGIVSIAEVTPVRNWLELEGVDYKIKKTDVKNRLLKKYNQRFPGLIEHTVVTELGTPRTMKRYTRNHDGAVYGLAQRVDQSHAKRLRSRTPIAGLYLTGAWTWSGGGYEGAIMTGMQTAQAIEFELQTHKLNVSSQQGRASFAPPAKDVPLPRYLSADEEHYLGFGIEVLVSFDDIDRNGEVDTHAYLRYMDRARVEAIEELAAKLGQESWLSRYIVNVYRIDIAYAMPAGLGQRLKLRTGIRRHSTHRAIFDQVVVDATTGKILAAGAVEILFLEQNKQLSTAPAGLPEGRLPTWLGALAVGHSPIPFSNDVHYGYLSPMRVYYEDTDTQGITYHVSYLKLYERALLALLVDGGALAWLMQHRIRVAKCNIRYLNASTLGDHIDVRLGGRLIDEHRMVLDGRILDRDKGKIATDSLLELEFFDKAGARVLVPQVLKDICSEEK